MCIRDRNDYERNLVKPLNTIRIAIVGDSFIEALQVDKSKAVGQITELWLEENCNNFDTLNPNFPSFLPPILRFSKVDA